MNLPLWEKVGDWIKKRKTDKEKEGQENVTDRQVEEHEEESTSKKSQKEQEKTNTCFVILQNMMPY